MSVDSHCERIGKSNASVIFADHTKPGAVSVRLPHAYQDAVCHLKLPAELYRRLTGAKAYSSC